MKMTQLKELIREIINEELTDIEEAWEGYSLDRLKTTLKNYEDQLHQLKNTNLSHTSAVRGSGASRVARENSINQAIGSLKRAITDKSKKEN